MSKLDIIALILITIHSIFRTIKPTADKAYKSAFGIFITTFIKDVLIYIIASTVISFLLGLIAPFAFIDFMRRSF